MISIFKIHIIVTKRVLKKNQKGQALLEYILLLLVTVLLAFLFLKIINQNIAALWLDMVQQVVKPYPGAPIQNIEFN